jgi:hypothetical protein
MADLVTHEARADYGDKDEKVFNGDNVSFDSNEKKGLDDAAVVNEIEAFEDRLQHDEAADDEYLIQDASDVALKVFMAACLLKVKLITDVLTFSIGLVASR